MDDLARAFDILGVDKNSKPTAMALYPAFKRLPTTTAQFFAEVAAYLDASDHEIVWIILAGDDIRRHRHVEYRNKQGFGLRVACERISADMLVTGLP